MGRHDADENAAPYCTVRDSGETSLSTSETFVVASRPGLLGSRGLPANITTVHVLSVPIAPVVGIADSMCVPGNGVILISLVLAPIITCPCQAAYKAVTWFGSGNRSYVGGQNRVIMHKEVTKFDLSGVTF